MTESSGTPGASPGEPGPEPRPTRSSVAFFVLGVVLGLGGTLVPAFLIAMTLGMGASKQAPVLTCVIELAGFLLMLWLAFRSKRQGLTQGVIVGGAVAFLLCAACWGIVAITSLGR